MALRQNHEVVVLCIQRRNASFITLTYGTARLLAGALLVQDYDSQEEDLSKQKAPDKPSKLPMPKSVLDCFTGRYLYQVYNVWKQEAHRQHEIAQDHEE